MWAGWWVQDDTEATEPVRRTSIKGSVAPADEFGL